MLDAPTPANLARSLIGQMVCDFGDAVDLAGAASRDDLLRRGKQMGWKADPLGWMQGRHFCALYHPNHSGGMDLVRLYLSAGGMSCKLTEPQISVCDGPVMFPFPDEDELLDEFDLFSNQTGFLAAHKPFVAAAYRALCMWFDIYT